MGFLFFGLALLFRAVAAFRRLILDLNAIVDGWNKLFVNKNDERIAELKREARLKFQEIQEDNLMLTIENSQLKRENRCLAKQVRALTEKLDDARKALKWAWLFLIVDFKGLQIESPLFFAILSPIAAAGADSDRQ